ncbi:uncharacterized protein LOC130437736 [Triplophysa dalaica]|uniref:uncharacterized protein LOC130437736 n=1 Tax=Triplophysa dalaica TaxID=1582913 RepID=UPI0024DFC603|nr:uncharacterized protein LOC130437736 [Triplophysa dalaica]
MENKKPQWCIVQFKNGGTEIVPQNWLHGDKLSWPPFTSKDRSKIHAAVKNYLQPGDGWIFYEPVRRLISRDTYEEAQRSLQKYLKDNCDTTDMQSDEECDGRPRRKFKPNPLYSQTQDVDSEEEGTEVKKKKFAQAPRIVMPEGSGIVGAATSSSGIGKSSKKAQGLSAVGAHCGPLHSDIKAALSLETDAHHHEPTLHQLLPAVKEPGSAISSNATQKTTWNDRRAYEQVDYRPFNKMHPTGRNEAPSHSMGEYNMYNDSLYESQCACDGPSEGHFQPSLTHGQRMQSDSRQIIKDIAYSKLTETLAELVSEVKDLRLEVQGFMRRQLPITPALPLSLPLKSMPEFEEAERILQSEDARRVMVL